MTTSSTNSLSSTNQAMQLLRNLLAVMLSSLLLLPAPLAAAQAAGAIRTASGTGSHQLHIVILDGEGALNNIRQRTAREPIVQVQDENHKPVAGALVLFFVHSGSTGASATFSGASSLSVRTGADGEAHATGLQPNDTAGQLVISVEATLGTLMATAVIHQTNSLGATLSAHRVLHHGLTTRTWLILGVSTAAAAGVATGIAVTRGSGGAVITPGKGTVTP